MMAGSALAFADRGFVWKLNFGRAALPRQGTQYFRRKFTDPSHGISSISAPPRGQQSEETEMRNRSSIDRKIQSGHDRKIPAQEISQADLAQIVSGALERAFGGTDAAIKRVQAVANCNERAARNWIEGRNAPNALFLLRLMAEVPELQAEMRRLTAMEADLDPEFGRAMSEAVRLFQQIRATP